MEEKSIILFDGVCNFCNGTVQFIIKHDPSGHFQFAPIQSTIGKQLLANSPELRNIDSVILIKKGKIKTESSAALHISKQLNGWPKLFYPFIIIPAPIRNYFYRMFAKNRYKLFGKSDTCMIPSKEVRDRFLSL